jgi:hypothetical protein
MADQAKDRPQQSGQTAESRPVSVDSSSPALNGAGAVATPHIIAGTSRSSQLHQEAIPLPSTESDSLTEAARYFRDMQAKSAGITNIHRPGHAVSNGDLARDLLKDDGQLSNLAQSAPVNGHKPNATLPTDMQAEDDSAAARVTPRLKLRPAAKSRKVIDVDSRTDLRSDPPSFADNGADLPLPATTSAMSPSPADETRPSALLSLAADARGSFAADPGTLIGVPRSDDSRDKPTTTERASVLIAGAPIVTLSERAPIESATPTLAADETRGTKLPPLPAIDRERLLPTGPSGNLRLFAGLSVVIAAFAGSLVWVAMWRADSFNGTTQATIQVSPEDLVQTAAGGNGDAAIDGTATLMVRNTELLLAKLAFDPGPADGVLDDTTREAIRHYQLAAGLPETGEPSKALLEELQAVVAAINGN